MSPALSHVQRDQAEDIAVVGMACRVAGSNDTPEKLWQALLNKEVASGEIPAMRWEPYFRRDVRNPKVRGKCSGETHWHPYPLDG